MTDRKGLRARLLSYANITSTLALALVVGGGTAYAAGLAPGSVGTEQLQKGAVTGPKVRNGSVGLGKLATTPLSDAVTRGDYLGMDAAPGANQVSQSKTVMCAPGERVLAGGHDVISSPSFGGAPNVVINASRPAADDSGSFPETGTRARGWYVEAWRDDGSEIELVAIWVMCGR